MDLTPRDRLRVDVGPVGQLALLRSRKAPQHPSAAATKIEDPLERGESQPVPAEHLFHVRDSLMSALKKSPHVVPNYSYLEVPRRWRSAPQLMDERLELLHRDPEFLY